MKTIKLIQIFFLLYFSFSLSAQQTGYYDVTFDGINTTPNVTPGDVLQVDVIQGQGIPNHGCVSIESLVTYDMNFSLIDLSNNNIYPFGTSSVWSVGVNCASASNVGWNNPGIQSLVVPCNLPTGNYSLRMEIDNAYSSANGGPAASQMGFYANDINNGNNMTLDYINNTNPSGAPLYADLLTISNTNLASNTMTDITTNKIDPTCGLANGSISANPVGGVGPFTYEWFTLTPIPNPPYYSQTNTFITGQTASGLTDGHYSVTVTDQGTGCTLSLLYGLNNEVELINPYTLQVDETIIQPCNYDEGNIDLTPLNGVGPYTYDWNTGDQTPSLTNVTEGGYTAIITDANGCTANSSISLTNSMQPADFDYPNGLIISSSSQLIEDLNSDGVIRIRGTLTFNSNVNYNFSNKTIEFARDQLPLSTDQGHTHSGVIVEPKAKVTANNVTFKGLVPCNKMWDGIQVWGDEITINPSHPNFYYVYNNGELNLNNCTIKDAHVGVALYRRNKPFIANPPEYGRGLLHSEYSDFINNHVSIDFLSNNNVTNNSTILESEFIADAPLIETDIYNGLSSEVFIRLQGVKKPMIAGNKFYGMASNNIGERGTGIRSYRSSYTVQSGNAGTVSSNTPPKPNIFNDLDQGIDIYSLGGTSNTIKIKDNRFNNVYQGITSNGSNFDEISFNVFNVPQGDVNFNSWGIFLQTSAGFLVTENTLNTTTTNDFTFGVITKEVNLINGEVYKNTFGGDFYSATQAEGNANNQLQIDCNKYIGANENDWTILSQSVADQGVCGFYAEDPSTNVFNPCSANYESNIYSLASFNYSSIPGFEPNCVSLTSNIIPCINLSSATYEVSCPQVITSPCPTCINELVTQFEDTEEGLKRQKIKGELIRRLAQEEDYEQLIDILTSEETQEDKKIIILTQLSNKKHEAARDILENLEMISDEDQDFFVLINLIIEIRENERQLIDIESDELSLLNTLANSETEVSSQAKSLLAEYYQSRYISYPQRINNRNAMIISPANETDSIGNENEPKNLIIYPNPSDGDFTIEFNNTQAAKGYILDPLGRKIKSLEFTETKRNYEISDLSSGVYTIVINYVDGQSENKRLIIK